MSARKSGLQVFYPKKLVFQPHFNHKTLYKHPENTKKTTYQPIKPKEQSKPLNQTGKKNIPHFLGSSLSINSSSIFSL
jgi:hypothetical protein